MIQSHHIQTTKTARYFVLGDLETAHHIWVVLHGYGQSAERFLTKFEGLQNSNTAIIAPEGLHRFYTKGVSGDVGASWMTKDDRETDIVDYVNFLNLLISNVIKPHQTLEVLGFSQGAATACRWLASGKVRPRNLILWAGMMPTDVDLSEGIDHLRKINLIVAFSKTDQYRTDDLWFSHLNQLKKNKLRFAEFEYEGGHRVVSSELLRLTDIYINPLLSS